MSEDKNKTVVGDPLPFPQDVYVRVSQLEQMMQFITGEGYNQETDSLHQLSIKLDALLTNIGQPNAEASIIYPEFLSAELSEPVELAAEILGE